LYFVTTKILEGLIKKGKEMVRTGQDRTPPLVCPNWDRAI
jgi:hypothetical protein